MPQFYGPKCVRTQQFHAAAQFVVDDISHGWHLILSGKTVRNCLRPAADGIELIIATIARFAHVRQRYVK